MMKWHRRWPRIFEVLEVFGVFFLPPESQISCKEGFVLEIGYGIV
jgi:hypothetical protein